MNERIIVGVRAVDPISRAGVASQLRARPEVRVLDADDPEPAAVAVVVADDVDEPTVRMLRSLQRSDGARVVLVAGRLDDAALFRAVEAGVSAVVRRHEASPERLVGAVRAAREGDGSIPPDLLGGCSARWPASRARCWRPVGCTSTG